MANIQEELHRRQETVKLLNEYGFFLILKGLSQQEFNKIKIVTYRNVMADYGVVRCQICFADFMSGDRVK